MGQIQERKYNRCLKSCCVARQALTGVFLGIMATFCFLMSFTDSITDANGKIRYGIVTPWGLWWSRVDWAPAQEPHAQPLEQGQGDEHQGHGHDENGQLAAADPKLADEAADQPPAGGNNPPPQAAPLPVVTMVPALPTDKKYKLRWEDWVHAVISVCTFVALALLTPPVSTCYFKNHLAPNISITVPIFVGILASVAFTFIGPPRNGIGFPNQDLAAAADAVRQANPQIIIHLPPAAAAAAVAGNSLVAGTP